MELVSKVCLCRLAESDCTLRVTNTHSCITCSLPCLSVHVTSGTRRVPSVPTLTGSQPILVLRARVECTPSDEASAMLEHSHRSVHNCGGPKSCPTHASRSHFRHGRHQTGALHRGRAQKSHRRAGHSARNFCFAEPRCRCVVRTLPLPLSKGGAALSHRASVYERGRWVAAAACQPRGAVHMWAPACIQ
jgi:hypothetical protein